MKMDKFTKTYRKLIAESEGAQESFDEGDALAAVLEENGYAPMEGRAWETDDGYSVYWGKNLSENIVFLVKVSSGSVRECEICFTKVNRATLFYSNTCKDANQAISQLDAAFEEIKAEFVG